MPEQALEKIKKYKVDAVLIGRGALRNPFFFEQAFALWQGVSPVQPNVQRYLQLLEDQQKLFEEFFPPRTALIHVKKFLAWYSAGFPGCHEFRKFVFQTSEPQILWEETRRFFERATQARDLSFLSQPFLMGGHG
jgi:tRNA-dihydrouridine synthase